MEDSVWTSKSGKIKISTSSYLINVLFPQGAVDRMIVGKVEIRFFIHYSGVSRCSLGKRQSLRYYGGQIGR